MNIRDPDLERIIEDATVRNFLRCRETGYQLAEARALMHSVPAAAIERGVAGLTRQIEQLRPFLADRSAPHVDNEAVDRLVLALALVMKSKLAIAREKGRGGWDDPAECTNEDLSRMLREHVDKGDPVDVANFCAFLVARGEQILADHPLRPANPEPLDWSNFEGAKRNPEWKPDDQDLIYTAINYRDDEYGDSDEDAGQQIVERLLTAWRASVVSEQMTFEMSARLLRERDQLRSELAAVTEMQAAGPDETTCPICQAALKAGDVCATDIEMGTCHAGCLQGSPVVDLETGDELPDGELSTSPFA